MSRTSAVPSRLTPAVLTIAAPEGLRGNVQQDAEVSSFSQQDFDKFLQGYKSQYKELSFWVEGGAIEGVTSVVKSICDTCWTASFSPIACLTAIPLLIAQYASPYCKPDSAYSILHVKLLLTVCATAFTQRSAPYISGYCMPDSTQPAHCAPGFSLEKV